MTTATAEIGAGSTPAPAPAPVVDLPDSGGFDGDTLSAEEEAYFESGGEKGLDGEGGDGEVAEPAPKAAAKAPAKGKDAAKADGDEGSEVGEAAAPAAAPAKQTTVPHAALHEEREGHKATKAERQAAIERAVRAEAKLQMIAEAFQARKTEEAAPAAQQAAQPEPMPDPQKDIFGAFDWLVKQHTALQGKLGEAQKQTGEQVKQTQEQFQAHQNHVALQQAYNNDVATFQRDKAPDYVDAYYYLLNNRASELHLLGYSQEQIVDNIRTQERDLAHSYLSRGQSYAAKAYELAVHRGYVKKAAPDPEPAPDPAKPAAKKPTAGEVVDAIAAGQSAARTLSNTGGSAGDTLTPEALLNMNEEDFAKACAKMTPAQEREFFGG